MNIVMNGLLFHSLSFYLLSLSLSVSLSLLKQSKSIITKGGLWTVDSSYRESLLSALKLNPYHPYHKYFTPPYFPRYMVHTPFKHT